MCPPPTAGTCTRLGPSLTADMREEVRAKMGHKLDGRDLLPGVAEEKPTMSWKHNQPAPARLPARHQLPPGPPGWGRSLSLPRARVLTSVCALGSPALAFSRTSSKGIPTSAHTGPLTQENQGDGHQVGPCRSSEEEGTQERASDPGQERESGCGENEPGSGLPPLQTGWRTANCPGRPRGLLPAGAEAGDSDSHGPVPAFGPSAHCSQSG